MSQEDIASRMSINLMTSATEGYDEVVAFTERIINQNFEELFKFYKDELGIVSMNKLARGSVQLELDAPRILIPGDNTDLSGGLRTVLYQIRVIKGHMTTPYNVKKAKMDGWELAVACELGIDTEIDKKGTVISADGVKKVEASGRVYHYPGSYSVQRLFAQIATASWNNPDVNWSKVIDHENGGKKMTLAEWKKNHEDFWGSLQSVLSNWATENQEAGRSTMNVTFKIKERKNVNDPTYVPNFLHQQIYPYKNPKKNVNPDERRTDGKSLNCLLWCEMVDGSGHKAPRARDLSYSGNLVVDNSGLGTKDAIDGTFALNDRLFLQTHILPRLRPFNQAADIGSLWSKHWIDDEGTYRTDWNYSVGKDSLAPDCTHKDYDYKKIGDQSPNAKYPVYYYFTKHNIEHNAGEEAGREVYAYSDGKRWHWHKHYSDPSVTIGWKPNEGVLRVEGKTDYVYDAKYARNAELTEVTGLTTYSYTITWNFDIALVNIVNGVIQFDVRYSKSPFANLKVTPVKVVEDSRLDYPKDQRANIEKWFKERLEDCIDELPDQLNQQLRTTAKFIYPGNGDLEFSNPVFSNKGNLLAEIKFRKLESDSDYAKPKKIDLPMDPDPPRVPDVPQKDHRIGTGSGAVKPKLTWSATPAIPAAEQKQCKITLKGQNDTKESIYFGYVQLKFTSASVGANLFGTDEINGTWAPGTDPKDKPKNEYPDGAPGVGAKIKKLLGLGTKKEETQTNGVVPVKSSADPMDHEDSNKPDSEKPDSEKPDFDKPDSGKPMDGVSGSGKPNDGENPPTEEPEPKPELPSGKITIVASSTTTKVISPPQTFSPGKAASGLTVWTSVIVSEGDYFVVPARESVSYEFEIPTGVANTYPIEIGEQWMDPKNPSKELKPINTNDEYIFDLALKSYSS